MANPADNLDRIADLAGEIRDFTYNSSNSLAFIDIGMATLSGEIAQLPASFDASIQSLDQTLVMVGNNIAAQIQASGGTTLTTSVMEQELFYQTALLENISQTLIDIQDILMASLRASNMNFNSLQDQDCCEKLLDAIKSLGNKIKGGGGGGGGGGRPVGSGSKDFLDSLKGGIITATVGLANQIDSVRKQFQTFSSGNPLQMISGFVGMMGSVPSIFTSIINMASKFVMALDPAIMAQLSLTFQDLMATVGIGLRPVIQAAIPIVRAFADIFTPIMNTLAPVMQQFGSAMIQIAIPVITIWASAISYLIPVIESLIPLFVDIAEILMVLTPVFTFFFDALSRGLNFIVGIFHTFMVGIKAITVALLEAAAWITSWVSKSGAEALRGASASVQESMNRSMEAQANAFGKWLGPSPKKPAYTQGASVGAAAKQASYSGIADLGKNMMQAAFGQSAQNAALETANNTKDMAEGMKQLVGWALGQGNENRAQRGVRN